MSGGTCDDVCGDGICSGSDTCVVSSPTLFEGNDNHDDGTRAMLKCCIRVPLSVV